MKLIQSLKFAAGLGGYILTGKVTDNTSLKISGGIGGIVLTEKLDKFIEKKRAERKMRAVTDEINDEVASILSELLSDDEDDDEDDSDIDYELDIPESDVSEDDIFPFPNATSKHKNDTMYDDEPEEDFEINQIRTPSEFEPIPFIDEHKQRRANRRKTNQAKKRLGGGKHSSRFDDWEDAE